jgi:hypothetical protein
VIESGSFMTDSADDQAREVAHIYLDILTAMAAGGGSGGVLDAVARAAERLNVVSLNGVLASRDSDDLVGTLAGDALVTGAVSVIYLLLRRAAAALPNGDEHEIIAWVREQLDDAWDEFGRSETGLRRPLED